jgi:dihydrofolate reductase
MLEVIYYVATSLDRYIATADGSVDWLSSFHSAGEDLGAAEVEASVDALPLGSRTYEFALGIGQWPSPDKPSWIFTHRDLRALDPSIMLTSQTPAEVVALLESLGIRRAWLMGGGNLAASFHADGLISRYILSIFPVLLGSGVPLFAPHSCAGTHCASLTRSLLSLVSFSSRMIVCGMSDEGPRTMSTAELICYSLVSPSINAKAILFSPF